MSVDRIYDLNPGQMAIRIGIVNSRIVVMYEKPVDHIELSKDEATQWVKILLQKINELTIQNGDGRLIGSVNA